MKSAFERGGPSGRPDDIQKHERLQVFLILLGRDASPSQGYPPAFSLPIPFEMLILNLKS